MTPRIRTALLLAVVFVVFAPRFHAASPDIVISQVYGGGGNSGATYTNDFIELYNRGSAAVDVTGWTVQYASAAGGTWQTTQLSGTIQPGRYFLVQEAVGPHGDVDVRVEARELPPVAIDQVEEATAGAFVFIPRGTPHTWEGRGGEACRFLVVLAPAGLESFFENTAPAGGGQADDAFDRFGGDDLRVVGPPLAVSHPL